MIGPAIHVREKEYAFMVLSEYLIIFLNLFIDSPHKKNDNRCPQNVLVIQILFSVSIFIDITQTNKVIII